MSRLPWDPAEIGTHEADLDGVADRLTRHSEAEAGSLPTGLAARIQAALDDEPLPAGQWWERLGGSGGWRAPARVLAAVAVLAAGVVGGLALGEFASQQNSGSGASPTPLVSPSLTPSPTPSPSPTPTVSPTPTSPSPSSSPVSSATITTPPPSATEEAETPEPSESDDSGSGNSGRGGGD